MKPLKYDITEYRGIKKNSCSRGSITLEATIFLTLFILFYMVLMSLVQIAKTQIILQYSINEVAKEVSAYSYLLTKTGIVDKRVSTSGQADAFKGKTTDMVNAIFNVGETFIGGGDAIGAAEEAGSQIEDYFGNTDELVSNILSVIKTAGADIVSDFVIQQIVESEVEKQIGMMSNKSTDKYLQDLGIKDGMGGLDFSGPNWGGTSAGGMPVLEVAVIYEMEYNLGFFELKPKKFKLCAKTALW